MQTWYDRNSLADYEEKKEHFTSNAFILMVKIKLDTTHCTQKYMADGYVLKCKRQTLTFW